MLYLGQTPDGQRLTYDPDDLTTHGLCVGMTGSGKTGLCVVLLEEAALAGVPAIVIDPKGDIADVLLQFPELAAEDFRPWVGSDEARRARLTLDELAAQTAQRWRTGLSESGLGPDDVARLKASPSIMPIMAVTESAKASTASKVRALSSCRSLA